MLQSACSAMSFYSLIAVTHVAVAAVFMWAGWKLNRPARPTRESVLNEVLDSQRTKAVRRR